MCNVIIEYIHSSGVLLCKHVNYSFIINLKIIVELHSVWANSSLIPVSKSALRFANNWLKQLKMLL